MIINPLESKMIKVGSFVNIAINLISIRQGLSKHIKYSCEKNKDEDFQELARLLNKNKNMTLIDELKEKNLVIKQITEQETAKANNTVDR